MLLNRKKCISKIVEFSNLLLLFKNDLLILGSSKILVTTGYNGEYLNDTEIIALSGDCLASLPNYPKQLQGATGQILDDKVIICGGYPTTNECFSLENGFTSFERITPMKEAKYYVKSAVTQGRIWITGGFDGTTLYSSTEYIPESSTSEPSLPEPVYGHAIVSINDTTSMLIGGWTNSNSYSPKTRYFIHQSQTWIHGPRLINRRGDHTAGLITDHVTHSQHIAVVGGTGYGFAILDTVEILFNGETQWKEGRY